MWCDQCQCDVKTVASPLGGPTSCTNCGRDLGTNVDLTKGGLRPGLPISPHPRRPDAHELLDRWSQIDGPMVQPEQLPVTPIRIPENSSSYQSTSVAEQRPDQVSLPHRRANQSASGTPESTAIASANQTATVAPHAVRVDAPHGSTPLGPGWMPQPGALPPFSAELGSPAWSESQRVPDGRWQQPHSAHAAVRPPHFATTEIKFPTTPLSSLWAGQIISLIGVMGLILGVLLLLYTHFLAAQRDALLAPGWVIAAVSQLFLMLGVVMNISAGLSQTNREVAWRVTVLSERLQRIETGGPPTASN